MADIFDYLAWRGDLDFSQSPFNPVDNIILSQLSYLPFDGIVPGVNEKNGILLHFALNILNEKLQSRESSIKPELLFKQDQEFINALLSAPRYRNCYLFGYVNKIDNRDEIQLSAVCIYTGDGYCTVIYRGTDSSLIGWKENFNMAFKEIIPAQTEAVNYLDKMGSRIKGSLRICGHSKGGNLAIFASAFCKKNIQRHIKIIYSNDAPGFSEKIISSGEFNRIKDKIRSFIPQTSVIGMLLEHGYNYTVIKSNETGLMQHLLFSWEVTHNDMVRVDEVSQSSLFVNQTVREWLNELGFNRRRQVIEAVYKIMNTSEIKSTNELQSLWFSSIGKIIKSFDNVDEATKRLLRQSIAELLFAARRNINTLLKTRKNEE